MLQTNESHYLLLVDVQDSFKGEFLKVQAVTLIIICTNSLGVVVYNNLMTKKYMALLSRETFRASSSLKILPALKKKKLTEEKNNIMIDSVNVPKDA